MNWDFSSALTDALSGGDLSKITNADGPGDVLEVIAPMIEDELEPHFEDIQERASQIDPEEAREYYESLDPDEKQEVFDEAVADMIKTLRLCREQPLQGYPMLKQRLRDPDVLESLLLIFDDDEHIDDEHSKEMKELVRDTIAWAGVSTIPEAYTDAEQSDIERRIGGQ